MNLSTADILNYFSEWKISENDRKYLIFHLKRYAFLLETINGLLSNFSDKSSASLLDIGPCFQTVLMRKYFPNMKIDALGIPFSNSFSMPGEFKFFDFNYCFDKEKWPQHTTYDIVVMAEVLEYLFAPPEYVYEFIESLIKPGGFFILQVSNGVAMFKRLNFLLGKKVCGKVVSKNEASPHIREYALGDLIFLGDKQKLKTSRWFIENYYQNGDNNSLMYLALMQILKFHKNFNEGITIIYQK